MSDTKIPVNVLDREQWEQREHAIDTNASSRSLVNLIPISNGNALITKGEPPSVSSSTIFDKSVLKLPCFISHPSPFLLNGKIMSAAVYLHNEQSDELICSPMCIIASTSSENDDNFGRLLEFQDSNGKIQEWAMPMRLLKGNGDELRGELLDRGVIIDTKNGYKIKTYVMQSKPACRITAVNRIGWHNDTFVLPNQIIGDENIVFQSENSEDSGFKKRGTLEEWQQQIAKTCIGNIPLMVSVSAALAGPLLNKIGRQQGGGIHWVGDSSTGKSTAIEVGGSVWGGPEFVRSWSSTANGLEAVASARNDTCLILDEIDEAPPQEIGKITYMLSNGQGKQRARRNGKARKTHRWRIITISTGERTITSIMNEIGKFPNSGQLVRLISIPVAFEHGAFSNLHGFEGGHNLSDHLKSARLNHHGHVGPAFIKALIDDKQNRLESLHQIMKKFESIAPTRLQKRAASLFAVIGFAGELAIEYGILPWTAGSALEAALSAFKLSEEYIGNNQGEEARILQSVSDFISKHGGSRFSFIKDETGDDKRVYNRVGWYRETDQGTVYMFTKEGLMEACKGFELSRVIRALWKAGWIIDKDSDNRYTKKTRIKSESKSLYHIRELEFSK